MASTTHSTDVPRESADMLTMAWERDPGFWGWVTAVNHKTVGMRFIVTGLAFLLAGGVMALLMRLQLAVPENSFLSAEIYNQLFTMHGTTMMFLFAVPILEGVAIYLLPLMLGTRDLPFPRLNAFGYWTYLFGGLFVFSSFLVGQVPSEGWFAYVPLASSAFTPDKGMDFWLLGVTLTEISGIIGALELVVGFFRRRAPGMSLNRIPLFAWAAMVMGAMMVVAFPALVAASTMLELERTVGLIFYDPSAGGEPLLWQHLFWFFGHPEVYIMLLPAVGMVTMIVPVFSRRAMAGYGWVVAAIIAIGIASFGLWVHHMFTVGLPSVAFAFFTAASVLIAIPSGVLVFAVLATMWNGRPVYRTPLLFVLGFLVVFVIGGISGVMVASVPFDWQVHDSFFLVAHFHYVLLGGVLFPLMAALYHWFPKVSGRLPSEKLGRTSFWTMLVGVNLAFFPQHFVGLQGMPRRVFTYPVGLGWELGNMLSTIGAFVLAAGVLVALFDLVTAARRGAPAGDDPWQAGSLEWATSSPPPPYNFRWIPVVSDADPLWSEGPGPTDPALDRPAWMEELAEPQQLVREVVDTSPIEGEPQTVVRLPGASPWPMFTAVGLVVGLVGVLASSIVASLGGTALTVAALIAWGAADPHVKAAGVEAESSAPSSSGIWGLTVGLVSLSVVLGSLIFGYWLIAGSADQWPPPGADRIGVLMPLVAAVLMAAAVVSIRVAGTASDAGREGGAVGLLVVAALLSVGFSAVATTSVAGTLHPIVGSAYGSVVATLVGFVVLLAVFLTFGLASVIVRVLERSATGAVAFRAAAIFATFTTVAWLVVAAVVIFGQSAGVGAP